LVDLNALDLGKNDPLFFNIGFFIITFLPRQQYLRQVDRFNESTVSAFVTAGQVKLLLLHDRGDDGAKAFFQEVYELYVLFFLLLVSHVNDVPCARGFCYRLAQCIGIFNFSDC
jgi:hypothetical protein